MRPAASVLAACLTCLVPGLGAAQKPTEPAPKPPGSEPDHAPPDQAPGDDAAEDVDAPPTPGPAPADTLGGHLVVSAAAGLLVPFGELQNGLAQSHVIGPGLGIGLELGYGMSRTLLLGVWGQGSWLGAGTRCTDCSGAAVAVGPFVRYHLVQGVRFDPWVSAGFGYRATTITASSQDFGYSGVDLLRLQLGGDWYAIRDLGLAPFLDFTAGTYLGRPETATALGLTHSDGGAAYYSFGVGARVTFDTPGK
jgi:hypothetical protein